MEIGKLCEAIGIEKETVETGMSKVGEVVSMGRGMNKVEIDIEKVREAATSHFEDLTKDQKEAARSFFGAMDKDKSGSISVEEFTTFLTLAGFDTENCDWLFDELDKDKDGTLDFTELVTFFYVLHRDEYKHLLSRANTGGLDRKAGNGRPTAGANARPTAGANARPTTGANDRSTAGANDPGKRWNMGVLSQAYYKLKDAYKLDWANVSECSIV